MNNVRKYRSNVKQMVWDVFINYNIVMNMKEMKRFAFRWLVLMENVGLVQMENAKRDYVQMLQILITQIMNVRNFNLIV